MLQEYWGSVGEILIVNREDLKSPYLDEGGSIPLQADAPNQGDLALLIILKQFSNTV